MILRSTIARLPSSQRMPYRAPDNPSPDTGARKSGKFITAATIAIAVFNVVYFGGQLLRVVLS